MTTPEWEVRSVRGAKSPQAALEKRHEAERESAPWRSRCTIGITAFERPRHLERLVRSIRRRCGDLRIVVADNGRLRARLPQNVQLLELPFDCGLSRARNALIDATDSEYLLILEEDFRFTEESTIEKFVEILDHDPELGVVGGSLYCEGVKQEYAVMLDRFRDVVNLRPACGGVRVTSQGTAYQICDMCFNFALFRRDMLREHRWPDKLKLGEHLPYFDAVKQSGRWRVASCDAIRCDHDRGGRSESYKRFRGRAHKQQLGYLTQAGIESVETDSRVQLKTRASSGDRPNVVVLGVGHSGTSILTKILMSAGWSCADADDAYGESVGARRINERLLTTNSFDPAAARRILTMPGPWVLKDPRFVFTLTQWQQLFAELPQPPLLLWIHRDKDQVIKSYQRRGEHAEGRLADVVASRMKHAARRYANWPWPKWALAYEDLTRCAELIQRTWRRPVTT